MMKLTPEMRKVIDDYFANITPEELYDELTNRYGLKDIVQPKRDLKLYRIKLKGYSLYFNPSGREGNSLNKRGKIYTSHINRFEADSIYLKTNSQAFNLLKDKFPYIKYTTYPDVVKFRFDEDDFEKEYV